MPLPPLIAELSRRRVFRALVAYGIAAFAVLQVIEPIMHGLQWPDRVLSYVVVALALGFPLVVCLAWIFDVRDGRIERTAPVAPASGLRGVRLIAVLLAVGLATGAPGIIYFFAVRRTAPAAPPPVSIAVLPFVNMSSDKETDYFSDGITEELINALANIDGLRVVSRTAAFALKGQNLEVEKIGARLKVATLLEGSVRREGNALRVTAQLINVSDGYHLWSKSYDRELKGVFALEDEITRSIAQALQRKLLRGIKQPTADLAAHDLYLKGRYFWNKRTVAGFQSAAEQFEHAIQRDPVYAIAYAGLADAIALQCEYGALPPEAIPKAKAAALLALELDPGLAEAHTSLGNISMDEFDWPRALGEFRTAIELEPDYATAHQWYAEALIRMARPREAREEIRRAQLIDPTSLVISTVAGSISAYERDYGRAVEEFRATLEMEPGFNYARAWLARAYALQGRTDQALTELDKLHLKVGNIEVEARRAIIYAASGRQADALRLARAVDERSAHEFLSSTVLSAVWAAIGDRERAFAILQKGCASPSRPVGLWRLKIDPDFDPLRSDPRFGDLLKCIHLE